MGPHVTRHENWPSLLSAEIEASRRRPFAWGTNDCCQFVGRCVEAMTGENPAARWTGSCSTAAEAEGVLEGLGGGLLSAWSAVLGATIRPAFARRGDVVLIRDGNNVIVAIVDLSGERAVSVVEGEAGTGDVICFFPMDRAVVAWRV